MNKTVIYSVIGVAVLIAAGFIIKVPAPDAASGSWADNYKLAHPATAGSTSSQIKVPFIIKLFSKTAV
jgi:hypothetical protein